MTEFFVYIFGGNEYFKYSINELLSASFNGIVSEEYSFHGIRYYFPIVVDNNRYYIDDQNPNWDFTINGKLLERRKQLESGDYIVVRSKGITLSMLVIEYSKCTLDATAYSIEKNNRYFIGRANDMNIIVNTSDAVSRKHAAIRVDANGNGFVDDISGKAGVYVNGIRINSLALKPGDHIFILGITIIYYNSILVIPNNVKVQHIEVCEALDTVTPNSGERLPQYVRTPRIQKTLDTEKIEVDYPTSMQNNVETPFILQVGPSLTMTLVMFVSLGLTISKMSSSNSSDHSSAISAAVMAISMLVGALLWPKLLRNYNKKLLIKNEQKRQRRYREYLAKKEQDIVRSYERNTRIWTEVLYPSSLELINNVVEQNRHLWVRSNRDDDFLSIRLGVGERPFEVEVSLKEKRFTLDDDVLEEEAYRLAQKYKNLKNVPITLSLKEHKVAGVVGDFDVIAKNIIINLASLYSPDELKIVLVYNKNLERRLSIFNDLPHTWSSDMSKRYIATSEAEAYSLFSELSEQLQAREELFEKDDIRSPYYVVLSFDQTIIDSIPFKKILVNPQNTLGVSGIFFGERFNQIPKECDVIVQKSDDICGIYVKNENKNRFVLFVPDSIGSSDDEVDINIRKLVKGLAKVNIKVEKLALGIPDRISFMDMYQVGNVKSLNITSHWSANNSNKTLAAPIGVVAGGETFALDIHEKYHGCHGLVAGTTGSGKSEFLQAYILSMMINYSPNEVAFVLVDFKGGDMARPFLKSPHLAATISNLSGNTLYRALVSLEAEVKNRQRIFNESATILGIDKIDINSYHKYFKEHRLEYPLPHLVIVIDEFAQLKTKHPEFMEKLVDIAQVGRSLGIHLILATQKPSGVVDAQIWSNSRFRVCLKVMDKQDSADMINKPLAAMIKNPGRAYVQVGYDEIFELIQSGYSGADYTCQDSFIDEDSITVSMINGPGEKTREKKDSIRKEKTELTQLEAVMKEMISVGERLGIQAKKLWLNPLPQKLLLEDILDNKQHIFGNVTCGLVDLPHIQSQIAYNIDFIKDGHLGVYGSSGTGKSTLIQTIFFALAKEYSPKEFNAFVIDCNGGSLSSISKMPHCARYVADDSEAEVNRTLAAISNEITNRRKKFIEADCINYETYLKSHSDMPMIIVAIDNYAAFRTKLSNCEDLLIELISASMSCGIYFIVTGNSKNAIYYKILDHIKNIIVLNMNDDMSYRDILNVRVPVYPENIKGRGLIIHDKQVAEVQIAVPFDADSEVNRIQYINEFYVEQKAEYGELQGYTFDNDDSAVLYDENNSHEDTFKFSKNEIKKYISSNDADAVIIGTDLDSGEDIKFSLNSENIMFIANISDNTEVIKTISELIDKEKNIKVFSGRFEELNVPEYMKIYNIDSYLESFVTEDSVLFIDGFSDFYDDISNESLDLLEDILRSGEKKYIIVSDNMSRISDYNATELYTGLVKCDFGIFVGGGAVNEYACALSSDFYSIDSEYREKALKSNQAIVYFKDTMAYVQLGGVYE